MWGRYGCEIEELFKLPHWRGGLRQNGNKAIESNGFLRPTGFRLKAYLLETNWGSKETMWYAMGDFGGLQRDNPLRWEIGVAWTRCRPNECFQRVPGQLRSHGFGLCGAKVHVVQWMIGGSTHVDKIRQNGSQWGVEGIISRS